MEKDNDQEHVAAPVMDVSDQLTKQLINFNDKFQSAVFDSIYNKRTKRLAV